MSRKIDIRVDRTEFLMRASAVLRHPDLLSVKMRPPAAGPEVELTFRFGEKVLFPLQSARLIVTTYGMTVLASRERARSSELRREQTVMA